MANATTVIKARLRNQQNAVSRKITVAAGVTIPEGTLVSIDGSGNAIVAAPASRIAGVALETKEAGEVLTVWLGWVEIKLSLPSVAATDVGNAAYAADNQTAATSGTAAILGPIIDVETDEAWIALTTRV